MHKSVKALGDLGIWLRLNLTGTISLDFEALNQLLVLYLVTYFIMFLEAAKVHIGFITVVKDAFKLRPV